jgi:hypothetical protein
VKRNTKASIKRVPGVWMAKFSGLLRRGAIYHWRKRVPPARSGAPRPSHVVLSLGTSSPTRARQLAAELNVVAERLSEYLAMMNADQINGVFRQVLLAQTSKLEVLVAAESGEARRRAQPSATSCLRRPHHRRKLTP